MIKYHYFNWNGVGVIVLGFGNLNPPHCMVLKLHLLRERDEQVLLQIISEPDTQTEPFLNNVLSSRKHPRYDQGWMDFLYPHVELVDLSALHGTMDADQYRAYECRARAQIAPERQSVEKTLYGPIGRTMEV